MVSDAVCSLANGRHQKWAKNDWAKRKDQLNPGRESFKIEPLWAEERQRRKGLCGTGHHGQ